MQLEFDLGKGRCARDDGMERIAANNREWAFFAMAELHKVPSGWVGLPEDLWPVLIERLGKPTRPNIFGYLISEAERRGLLVKTGRRRPMRKRSSHARMTDEYMRP